ncbi:hypothetical protein Sjap_022312 [Stephania japonica]|uniref:Uncharacterized protein n=1 Tax=Stephania japonica TaxID=461633 RepID=A0AAP0ERA2_9MAGN
MRETPSVRGPATGSRWSTVANQGEERDGVDEEEYEVGDDALDNYNHDVGQPIEEEEFQADEDQNEEQMIKVGTDVQASDGQDEPIEGQMPKVVPADEEVDEEASDEEKANEGNGDEFRWMGHSIDYDSIISPTYNYEQMDEHEDKQIDDHIGEEIGDHDEHVDG